MSRTGTALPRPRVNSGTPVRKRLRPTAVQVHIACDRPLRTGCPTRTLDRRRSRRPTNPRPTRVRRPTPTGSPPGGTWPSSCRSSARRSASPSASCSGRPGIVPSTLGGYFSGRHVPPASSLIGLLRACGVTDPDAVRRWLAAAQRVRRQGRRTHPADPPYRGLSGFDDGIGCRPGGRARVVESLVGAVADGFGRGPLVLVGPIGSGTSSTLRVGLAEELRKGRPQVAGVTGWSPITIAPGRHPLRELAGALDAPLDPGLVRFIIIDELEQVWDRRVG